MNEWMFVYVCIMQSCWYYMVILFIHFVKWNNHKIMRKKRLWNKVIREKSNNKTENINASYESSIWYHLRHCYSTNVCARFFIRSHTSLVETLINLLYFITFSRIIYMLFGGMNERRREQKRENKKCVGRISSWLRQTIIPVENGDNPAMLTWTCTLYIHCSTSMTVDKKMKPAKKERKRQKERQK